MSEAVEDPYASDGMFTVLTPVAVIDNLVSLQFNTGVTFEIDLCFTTKQIITTTVIADTGIYTHFVCSSLPCRPDTRNQLAWQFAPLPVGTATGTINNMPKVYVSVFNLGGQLDKTTQKVMGQFRFAATLD